MLCRRGLSVFLALWGLMSAPGTLPMSADAETAQNAASLPKESRAVVPPRDVDTPRTFPTFPTRKEWEARRAFIRQHILVSLGLAPLPPKPPLKTRIFDRVERNGYTIEKVYFQTHPGFYLAGNLYRPTKAGSEKRPAVLVAHGHWGEGRMANNADGSISARAITFARQGYVAFTYDMVGYNDTRQINHQFANDLRHWLWGISLMGLQTWNSMRALDFLCSLPDVDKSRLAITGESGGGTQTMFLGATEDRLAAVGPCVMVSHTMQGGCLCENAPGLRVDFSNVEVAAVAAPKVQILVGATGDWTKTTMEMEGPSLASIYGLYGQKDNLQYVCYNYGHNINQTSREAVYAFLGQKLLGEKDAGRLKEPSYQMEPVKSLRVFPNDTPLPKDAKNADELTDYLIQVGKGEVERRKPKDKRSLTQFKKVFHRIWRETLNVEIPDEKRMRAVTTPRIANQEQPVQPGHLPPIDLRSYVCLTQYIQRTGRADSVPAAMIIPDHMEQKQLARGKKDFVVIAHPRGREALTTGDSSLVRSLTQQGFTVVAVDAFLTGERANANLEAGRKVPFGKFFSTYNRTNMQERVQDLLTVISWLRNNGSAHSITLVGLEEAGLWALLAAPAADAVIADCAQLDLTTDDALLTEDRFVPGLRRMGDFHTAAVLAAPHRLLLHNTGKKFTAAAWIKDVYTAIGASDALRIETNALKENDLLQWLAK